MSALVRPAAIVQALLLVVSFVCLLWVFAVTDLSVALVAANSHADKPFIYRISGAWGNHEGSMLLWVLILSLFGALAAWFGGNLPPTLRARVLGVQAMVGVAFYAFILFTSNPFLRLAVPPFDGPFRGSASRKTGAATYSKLTNPAVKSAPLSATRTVALCGVYCGEMHLIVSSTIKFSSRKISVWSGSRAP